jgi:hypothetical protein
MKKLTISVSDEVHEGLHRKIGQRRISKFPEGLAHPHVLTEDLEAEYRARAAGEDRERDVAEQVRRLGFMDGQLAVPEDFDRMGSAGIERLFVSDTDASDN